MTPTLVNVGTVSSTQKKKGKKNMLKLKEMKFDEEFMESELVKVELEKIRRSDISANIPNVCRVLWVYKILRELALDIKGATVEYGLFSSFPSSGRVIMKGKRVTILNKKLFLKAIKASNSFGAFSKIDGTVVVEFGFNDLIKNSKIAEIDEKTVFKFLDLISPGEDFIKEETEEENRESFVKSFDIVSMIVEEASNKFSDSWRLNEDKNTSLKYYCSVIDSLVDELELESLSTEIDENNMSIKIKVECIDLDIYEHEQQYFELFQKTKSIGFSAKDETNMWVEFVFSGVWDKQNNDN